ncbi:MAG: CRTAC1 family protein [Pirellulales bacterium]
MNQKHPNADRPDTNGPNTSAPDTNAVESDAGTNFTEADATVRDAAERNVPDRPDRKKIAIWVGIAVVVWIVAMIYKGSGKSDADAGRDELGRQETGIQVIDLDGDSKPKTDDTNVDGAKKPQYVELLIDVEKLDATVWANEVEAQRYEAAIVKLWDDIRAADDKMAIIEAATPPTVVLGSLGQRDEVAVGIQQIKVVPPGTPRSADEFRTLLARFRGGMYVVEQTEWRHVDFAPAAAGSPARSTVAVVIDAHGPDHSRRVTIRGNLKVIWSPEVDEAGHPRAESVDASELSLTVRDAPPAFVEVLKFETEKPTATRAQRGYRHVMPLALDDLDGDGLPELILGGRNLVYPNLGDGKFGEPRPFCPQLPFIASVGLLADFTGDGRTDFLCFDGRRQILVYRGDGRGGFAAGESFGEFPMTLPTTITAGDVDEDGDLDVFVGQYKLQWRDGQTPTPYYDANDGEPAFLLRNDGTKFTDVTESSGLTAKRNRRTYGASLVDLNDDGHLDLLVTSDFAGIDLYLGDGAGHFKDVTATMLGERHGLSAAHAFADFDADGRLDFFVASESSPVVRRLDKLGIGRTDRPEETKMRTAMGYGNRMFLARGDRFEPPPFADQLAQTAAPRGCAVLDLENDGDVDLYIVNGQQSGNSAADIGSKYWRHGIYLGSSQPDRSVEMLFDRLFVDPLRTRQESLNGFQTNALLLNRGDKGFLDVAYAVGVASQDDGRTALAGDIDNDGRVDLLLLTLKIVDGAQRETLYVLRNTLQGTGHWIGVRLGNSPSGRSPIGAKVTLTQNGKQRTAVVATGQSQAVQLGPVVHFGLGATSSLDKLEVRWPDGEVESLNQPAVDRYHDVGQRAATSGASGR